MFSSGYWLKERKEEILRLEHSNIYLLLDQLKLFLAENMLVALIIRLYIKILMLSYILY